MFLLRTPVSVDWPHKYFKYFFYFHMCLYMCVCVRVCLCVHVRAFMEVRGQLILRVDFFPSSIWDLGIKFMLSGLVTNTFTH